MDAVAFFYASRWSGMKTAFITGVTGQDGTYMAELLLDKGYCVVGGVRRSTESSAQLAESLKGQVELVDWDMSSQAEMVRVLRNVRPTEVYNFAAFTSGSGMYDDPVSTCDVNGLAVVRILEAIREADLSIRFCQASSREVFGVALESPQTETTLRNPRSPYGAAKAFADVMIQIYRQRYGVFASSAILYNHESPLRGLSFVTRKITHGAVLVKLGISKQLNLGDLDARRDWGYAADYVQAMWLMLQQSKADDYVICSGESYSVRDFCECAFTYLGLDYRKYVREDKSFYRPAEPVTLVGCFKKAKSELGWIPQTGFRELVKKMVDVDLKSMSGKN